MGRAVILTGDLLGRSEHLANWHTIGSSYCPPNPLTAEGKLGMTTISMIAYKVRLDSSLLER